MNFIKTNKIRSYAIGLLLRIILFLGIMIMLDVPSVVPIIFMVGSLYPLYCFSSFLYATIKFGKNDVLLINQGLRNEKLNVRDIVQISFSELKHWQMVAFGAARGKFATSMVGFPIMTIETSVTNLGGKGYKSFVDVNDFGLDEFLRKIKDRNPSVVIDDVQEIREHVNTTITTEF